MRTKSVILKSAIVVFSAFVFLLAGCKKDDNKVDIKFSVSMKSSTESRSNYEAVNIDIQEVSIHTSADSSESSGWFNLDTNTGIYDLMDFAAGNDTIIALDSIMQVQTVSQIRLVLGENNTVVENGETYDLDTPSAQTSGLKIQIHAELQPNVNYKVVLDFDADQSIIKTGNNKYKLQPVINATLVEY